MLKFFRKIRQKLLIEGSLKKYLIYALGEIALVVIGILIALQLNDWSQFREERKLEIEILGEIKDNLLQDLNIEHIQNLKYLNHTYKSSQIILDHLNNDLPYQDSLAKHFAWLPSSANFDPVTSGFELLNSTGVNIITNDSLRMNISVLYGVHYTWLSEFLKDRQYLNNTPLFNDMMKKFNTFKIYDSATPRDYEKLKIDDDFKVLVQQNGHIIGETIENYEKVIIKKAHQLVGEISEEIEKFK